MSLENYRVYGRRHHSRVPAIASLMGLIVRQRMMNHLSHPNSLITRELVSSFNVELVT